MAETGSCFNKEKLSGTEKGTFGLRRTNALYSGTRLIFYFIYLFLFIFTLLELHVTGRQVSRRGALKVSCLDEIKLERILVLRNEVRSAKGHYTVTCILLLQLSEASLSHFGLGSSSHSFLCVFI